MHLPSPLHESLSSDPVRFVDVGARGGWQRKWREHAEYVRFVGVEPDKEECARLRAAARRNEVFVDEALYHSVGEVSLYHCDPPARTSIYRPDAAAMQRLFGDPRTTTVTRIEPVTVTTLDRVLAKLGTPDVDFVKLDTQGSELDILRGAERALAGTMIGVELEVEFTPLYEQQPLFHDVAAFLHARRFELIDFPTTYSSAFIRFGHRGARGYASLGDLAANWGTLLRARGGYRGGQRLVYADAVFLRHPAAWVEAVRRAEPDARGVAVRGFTACCIVGYWEHATEIAHALRDASIFSSADLDAAETTVARAAKSWRRAVEDVSGAARRMARHLRNMSAG